MKDRASKNSIYLKQQEDRSICQPKKILLLEHLDNIVRNDKNKIDINKKIVVFFFFFLKDKNKSEYGENQAWANLMDKYKKQYQ